eukprot:Sspe_Gene.72051::Locus_42880_Transcript_1_1_Confidence_1.000_Length_2304::g.72051::m.72051
MLPKAAVVLPAKVLLGVTTVISTCISLLAGVLLYQESISSLHDMVEEVSQSDLASLTRKLQGTFSQCELFTLSGIEMFRGYQGVNATAYDEIIALFRHFSFSGMKPDLGGTFYAFGVRMTQTWPPPDGTAGSSPPWENRNGFLGAILEGQVDETGRALWHSVEYTPSLQRTNPETGKPYELFTGETHNSLRVVLDPVYGQPGEVLKFIKSDTRKASEQMSDEGLIAGSWTGPSVSDGGRVDIPQVYMRYIKVINGADPSFRSLGFPGWDIMLRGYVQFQPWMGVLREFQGPDTNLVAADFANGLVFAHTLHPGIPIVPGCKAEADAHSSHEEERDCQLTVSALGATVEDAAAGALERERGVFFTADLRGSSVTLRERYGKQEYLATGRYKVDTSHTFSLPDGEYFVLLRRVISYGGKDVDLLWMRPVSSVNDRVHGAMVRLVVLCVVIFVVDVFIAAAEVLLMARPLKIMSRTAEFITAMDLTSAGRVLETAASRCVVLKEVQGLLRGLDFAVCSLKEYKAFLPRSLFVEVLEEEEEEHSDTKTRSRRSEGSISATGTVVSSQVSRIGAKPKTDLFLSTTLGTLLRIEMLDVDPSNMNDLLSKIEDSVSLVKGVFHGFPVSTPNVLYASWGIVTRNSSALEKALAACFDLRKTFPRGMVCALATGKFVAGNVGTPSFRGFLACGEGTGQLRLLAAAGKEHSALTNESIVAVAQSERVLGRRLDSIPIDVVGEKHRVVVLSVL